MNLLRKINLPTWITFLRIALLPVILFFYIMAVSTEAGFLHDYGKLIAVILFITAAVTDWVDGYIARKRNLVTDFGKLLDHNADKMLTTLGFILILADPIWYRTPDLYIYETTVPAFPFWFAVIAVFVALGRDIVMSTLRAEAAKHGRVIAADRLGKFKSFLQFIAIPLYILLAWNLNPNVQFVFDGAWLDLWSYACISVLGLATVLSIWSCVNYVKNYMKTVDKSIISGVENGKK
jgi:CDP-diacylglycerol--glycerol-3-phosphate 3-phosphatidyltransferase